MDKAFLELLQEKDFEYITVKEICRRAGVNRSTFYLHYETIGDLLEESLEYIQNAFWASFDVKPKLSGDIKDKSYDELLWITPEYLRPYLQFIKDNQQLYRAAMENPVAFQSDREYKRLFEKIFDPVLERFDVPVEERRYLMAFYLKGISGIVEEWLRGGCRDDIGEMIGVIVKCVPRGTER